MSHRILLFTALGLLAGCDYLESYVSNEENVLQEDAACILLGVDPDTVVSDDGAAFSHNQ